MDQVLIPYHVQVSSQGVDHISFILFMTYRDFSVISKLLFQIVKLSVKISLFQKQGFHD